MNSTKLKTVFAFAAFPIAGMVAALVTIFVLEGQSLSKSNPFGSLFFGIAIALCLRRFSGLRSIRKTIAFILVSFFAAFLASWAALFAQTDVFHGAPPYRGALFVGGCIGAFALVATALLLFFERGKKARIVVQSAGWALAGGGLAVLGNASGNWFLPLGQLIHSWHSRLGELLLWHIDEVALLMIWQTGMGLVIALAVWLQQRSAALTQSARR